MKKIQKKRKGFTLIELVVVIVIIAILAAVALLRFGAFTETAKDSRIRSEHAQLIAAGNMWRASQSNPSTHPESLDVLKPYMEGTKDIQGGWSGGVHSLANGVLTSTLNKADENGKTTLTYDFKEVPTVVDDDD